MRFVFTLALVFCINLSVSAAPGDLDPTFGTGGKVILDSVNGVGIDVFTGSGFAPAKISLQTDGKILVAGNQDNGLSISAVLLRLNVDGTLDGSFGNGGIVLFGFSDLLALSTDIAVQPDNKIVVSAIASTQFGGNVDFGIARFETDGSLDTSFGDQGKKLINFEGNLVEAAFSVAIQADGKIVIAGSRVDDTKETSFFAIARLTSSGSLDSSFSDDGKLLLSAGVNETDQSVADSLLIQADGKLLVGGQVLSSNGSNFAVVRLSSDGSLDTSFDGDGKVQTQFNGFGIEVIRSMALQTDGKIVAAGQIDVSPTPNTIDSDFAAVRYNINGSLDTSFNGTGKRFFSFGNALNLEEAYDVAIQKDGKILLGGIAGSRDSKGVIDSYTALARLETDGAIDTGFGSNGFVTTGYTDPVNVGSGLAIQSDNKIIFSGVSGINDTSVFSFSPIISRHEGDDIVANTTRFDFTGDGKADISVWRRPLGEWWFLRSEDNQDGAFAFGSPTDVPVPADFTGDGIADFSFWRPETGEWFILRSDNTGFFSGQFGANGDIPAPGDFDGDGTDDLAVFRPSNGTWFIQRSSDNQTDFVQFGSPNDKPLVGDYDNDGTDDVAIYKPDVAQFWQLRSTEGQRAFSFGAVGDIAMVADFSGDGTDDMVSWRPSTGFWFVLRSEDSNFFGFPFGAAGDIPAPADYDGDGTADPTVFRPTDTTWYSQQSTSGNQFTPFGISADEPVPASYNAN